MGAPETILTVADLVMLEQKFNEWGRQGVRPDGRTVRRQCLSAEALVLLATFCPLWLIWVVFGRFLLA